MTSLRTYGIEVGAGVVLLVLAFLLGRHSAPAKVVTKDVVRVETVNRDVVKTQLVHDVQVVHDLTTQTKTVTVTKWAKAPDGTPVVTQETHQEAATADKGTRQAETKTAVQREADARQVVAGTKTVTVTSERPNWSISAQAGGAILGGPRVIPGLPSPLVAGVQVDRRILGPLFLGAWGNSAGMVGLSARLEL